MREARLSSGKQAVHTDHFCSSANYLNEIKVKLLQKIVKIIRKPNDAE